MILSIALPKAEPKPGEVWTYDYLWQREQAKGLTFGDKLRPACVAIRPSKPEYSDLVVFLGITTSMPQPNQTAVLVPDAELANAGLTAQSWVILNECNYERVADVLALDFSVKRGGFSAAFWKVLEAEILRAAKLGLMTRVQRD